MYIYIYIYIFFFFFINYILKLFINYECPMKYIRKVLIIRKKKFFLKTFKIIHLH